MSRCRSGRRIFNHDRLQQSAALLAMLFSLLAMDVYAAGTLADSVISNSAMVAYTQEGNAYTRQSNISSLRVDDKVSFTLVAADAGNASVPPSGRAYTKYILTNNGNAPHDFTLYATVAGKPTFTPSAAPVFYADAAGTVPLPTDPNAGGLPYLSNLAPESSITVYMFITAPAQLTEGNTISYNVTAEAYQSANLGVKPAPLKASIQAAIDTPANKNSTLMNRYLVLDEGHGNGGDINRDGKYAEFSGFNALSTAVNIVKSATVVDRFGGSQPASGATIRYSLAVSAAGAGTATGIVIVDPIPANTTYKTGTLQLNGVALSDPVDSDAGDFGGTTAGTVTVRLGDMSSSSPAQLITFEVKIN